MKHMTAFDQIAIKIIQEQELVIGPLAWSEAGKVNGLTIVSRERLEISIQGTDRKEVVDRLVAQYERLFGRASHEVCREAVGNLIAQLPPADVPISLR